jgi:hypothetical protein
MTRAAGKLCRPKAPLDRYTSKTTGPISLINSGCSMAQRAAMMGSSRK